MINHQRISNRLWAILFLASLLCFALPLVLRAQTAGGGTLSGTVTDGSGAAVGDATVTATNNATGIAATRTSTSAGLFTIAPRLRYLVSIWSQVASTIPIWPVIPSHKLFFSAPQAADTSWHGRGHRFDPDQVHQLTLMHLRQGLHCGLAYDLSLWV
jgi:hypothetical protein